MKNRILLIVFGFLASFLWLAYWCPAGKAEMNPVSPAPAENLEEPLFDNGEATLHFQKAVKLYQKKGYAGAIAELEQAIEINPDYKEAYYLLGYAYYKVGKMDRSRESFNQAYELDPKYSPLPLK